jgi:hypothetical protein
MIYWQYTLVPFIILVLIILHELGHVICAKLQGQKIRGVGVTRKPYPHFYVAIDWPRDTQKKLVYLFSGFSMYLLLVLLATVTGLFQYKLIQLAFILQFLIETNPMYSDFTIAHITNDDAFNHVRSKKEYSLLYKNKYEAHLFSKNWYLHFLIWLILLYFLTKTFSFT